MFCQVQIIFQIKKSVGDFSQFPSQCSFGRKKEDLFTFFVNQSAQISEIAITRKNDNHVNFSQILKYVGGHLNIKISLFPSIAPLVNNNLNLLGDCFKTNLLELSQKLFHLTIVWSQTNIITVFQNLILLFKVAPNFNPIQPKTGFLLGKVGIGAVDENDYSWPDHKESITENRRIFNYALTALQVKSLYNEGSAVRFGPASGSP